MLARAAGNRQCLIGNIVSFLATVFRDGKLTREDDKANLCTIGVLESDVARYSLDKFTKYNLLQTRV